MRNKLTETYRVQADEKIFQKLISLEWYQQAQMILSYVPYKSETDTRSILKKALKDGKTVASILAYAAKYVFRQ